MDVHTDSRADATDTVDETVELSSVSEADAPESSLTPDLQAKYDELSNQYLRLAADFDNYRKRQRAEMENLQKYGVEKAVQSLLPVLDNLDRASKSLSENSEAKTLFQSFGLLRQQLVDTLGQLGLKRMETTGKPFDPNSHEAVAQLPMAGQPDQSILEEQQSGYLLHDRVIRVAQVIVVNNGGAGEAPSPAQDTTAEPPSNPFKQA